MAFVLGTEGVPRCACGGVVRPDVVLYGETLNERDLVRAIGLAMDCGLMVVAGTSLVVYPVAGLVNYLGRKAKLVLINRDPTPSTAGRTCCSGRTWWRCSPRGRDCDLQKR